jgi:hypothetical protein
VPDVSEIFRVSGPVLLQLLQAITGHEQIKTGWKYFSKIEKNETSLKVGRVEERNGESKGQNLTENMRGNYGKRDKTKGDHLKEK